MSENKVFGIVGGVIALAAVFVGGFMFDAPPMDKSEIEKIVKKEVKDLDAGGSLEEDQVVFVNGIQEGSVLETWGYETLVNGQNQKTVLNTGRDRYVTLSRVSAIDDASGTNLASSTYVAYVGTTTDSTISDDYARTTNNLMLIDGGIIATSTKGLSITSTTTDSGQGTLLWKANEYLFVHIQQRYLCKEEPTGSTCETATSSVRGFNIEWAFKWNRKGDNPLR